jgi:hypothetical protein
MKRSFEMRVETHKLVFTEFTVPCSGENTSH